MLRCRRFAISCTPAGETSMHRTSNSRGVRSSSGRRGPDSRASAKACAMSGLSTLRPANTSAIARSRTSGRTALGNVTQCSGPHRGKRQIRRHVHAEHQYACCGIGGQDALNRLETTGTGHGQIGNHDHQGGVPETTNRPHGPWLPRDHGKMVMPLEKMPVAGANDGVIVHQQQACRMLSVMACSRAGRPARRTVRRWPRRTETHAANVLARRAA